MSKKQTSVALSTTEAEYVASAMAAKETVWLRRLIKDLTGQDDQAQMRTDSTSALALMENAEMSARKKHIDLAYHFVREKVAAKELVVKHVPTIEMTADILTKILPEMSFYPY